MKAVKQYEQESHFTWLVIKGLKSMDRQIVQLADTAWIIAYTALWHTEMVSEEEKRKCITLIKYHLLDAEDPQHAYTDMVQRILLARQYVMGAEDRYVPTPTEWFDPNNQYGFTGTEAWMQKLTEKRKALPLYRQGLKAFAEAVQDIAERGDAIDFHYWRSYFVERRWNRLLNLMLATVGNMRFEDSSK